MKTVSVTSDAGQDNSARRRALAAALAQQGGLGGSSGAGPAVAGAKGLALALGNFGASAIEGMQKRAEADKQAAGMQAAAARGNHMVDAYLAAKGGAPGVPGAGGGPGRGPASLAGDPIRGAGSSSNAATAVRYYVDKGMPEHSARALVGGFQAESGPKLNTGAVDKGDGRDGSDSVGIGQWNSGRAAALRQFAASNGRNPGDLQTQLDFSWQELNGPEKATLNRLMAAKDDREATAAAVGYERPAGWSADNPEAAVTFGKRLANTTALASLGGDPDMARTPQTPAGQLASTPGSTVTPAAMPNNDPDMMAAGADMPAPNAAPATASGLPGDMLPSPQPQQPQQPSPYGQIPAGTGDPAAQSLAWALGQQMDGQGTAPTIGTDLDASRAFNDAPGATNAALGADVGSVIAGQAGVPSFVGATRYAEKKGGPAFADFSGTIGQDAGNAPQMAADVPLPPRRPNQAIIDALGAPSSSTQAADATPTGSIDMGGPVKPPDMPAANAQPAMGVGTPATAQGFAPYGKQAMDGNPTDFFVSQGGGSKANALAAALGMSPDQAAAVPRSGPSPAALAGALGGSQPTGQPTPQGAAMANALGGGEPTVIPAPAGAPPAPMANSWQQDAASILSDPYSSPAMQKYAADLLEKANAVPEGFSLSPGQVRYDGYGRQVAAAPAAEKAAALQHMEVNGRVVSFDPSTGAATDVTPQGMPSGYRPATEQERSSFGVPAGTPLVIGPDGKPSGLSGGTTVNVDQKGETEEAKARGQGLAKRFNDMAEAGTTAANDALVVDRLGDLLGSVETGPKTAALERIRQMTGGALTLDPKTDNVQALNATVQYLAPRLRVPGSGAQSDRELGNFLASIPNLSATPGGNAQILATLRGMVQAKQAAGHIAQQYQLGRISAGDAQDQLDKLPSPFAATKPPEGASASAPSQQPAATTSSVSQQNALSSARDAIARGAPREAVMQRLRQNGIDPGGL